MFDRSRFQRRGRNPTRLHCSQPCIPLSFQCPGTTCRIKEFCGGAGMKRHLDDLGLISGDEITVLSENGGGIIVKCKGIRMAMNRGLAQHILTEA